MEYENVIDKFAELLDLEFGSEVADYFEYHTAREWGIHALSLAYGKVAQVVDDDLAKIEGGRAF